MKRMIVLMLVLLVFVTACAKTVPTSDYTPVTQTETQTDNDLEPAKETVTEPAKEVTTEPSGAIADISNDITSVTSEEDDLSDLDDLSSDLDDIDW